MELAGRVFDVVTRPENLHGDVRDQLLLEVASEERRLYWRRVLRLAALCHDIGHLPFSHAAEHELLPEGRSHELITRSLVESEEMRDLWQTTTPPGRAC